ncbi:hypothetical protein BZA70DRAFT_273122 [Myxozyma melibiosi]|uniref:MARVEL domain-containing protein n=1 Tax=Myxozyma melibiosi TaxID=54550 RepID=A0ABR1FEB1_9ASCO
MPRAETFSELSLGIRACQVGLACSTMLAVILYLHDLVKTDDLFAEPALLQSSGITICSWFILALSSAGLVTSVLFGIAPVSGMLDSCFKTGRVIVSVDLAFIVLWGFTMPVLLIVYPNDEQMGKAYKILSMCCGGNLFLWALSAGLDCLFTDDETVNNENTSSAAVKMNEPGEIREKWEYMHVEAPEPALHRAAVDLV